MAFKKRTFKKRTFKRKPKGQLVTKQFLRSVMKHQTELKYQVSNLNETTTAGTGAIAKIMTIAQGDTDSTRDGDALFIKGLRINGRVKFNNAMGALLTQYVRLLVFQWFPDDGTAPTVANILNTTGTDSESLYGITNMDRNDQYKILFDRTYEVDSVGNPARAFKRKLRIPKRHRRQKFIAAGTDGSNQIYLMYISDTLSTIAGVVPTFTMQTFMTYTDS